VNTNNGVERQNRALKYEYLSAYRDTTITGLMTVLIDKFFPDAYRKYVAILVNLAVYQHAVCIAQVAACCCDY